MAEVAYGLAPFTTDFVASEELVPGNGFDYPDAFSVLETNPGQVTADALSSALVQSYGRQYVSPTSTEDTLSTTRASEVGTLSLALRTFTTAVLNATAQETPQEQDADWHRAAEGQAGSSFFGEDLPPLLPRPWPVHERRCP